MTTTSVSKITSISISLIQTIKLDWKWCRRLSCQKCVANWPNTMMMMQRRSFSSELPWIDTIWVSSTNSFDFSFSKLKCCEYLNEKLPEEEGIDEALDGFRAKNDEIYQAALAMLSQRSATTNIAGINSTRVDDADNAEKENTFAQPSANTSANRSTAGTASTRGRGRPKAAAAPKAAPAPKAPAASKAKGTKKELNISVSSSKLMKYIFVFFVNQEQYSCFFSDPQVTRKTQPTIQQAMASPQTRSTRKQPVIYSLDSDDSDWTKRSRILSNFHSMQQAALTVVFSRTLLLFCHQIYYSWTILSALEPRRIYSIWFICISCTDWCLLCIRFSANRRSDQRW